MIAKFLKIIFYFGFVRPLLTIAIGLNIRHKERLPLDGPAIIVANHNSHLDTMTLVTMFPLKTLFKVRPIAAADYFMRNKLIAWFSVNVIGIIPLSRQKGGSMDSRLSGVFEALDRGEIVILFPEGSRGQPEELQPFKKGISYISKKYPDVPITPVFMHGMGKVLPKGEALLVPFFCDVFCGEQFSWRTNENDFMEHLETSMNDLASEGKFAAWE